jgi:transposase
MSEASIEKIRIAWKMYQTGISAEKIPVAVGVHRATVYRWFASIHKYGFTHYLEKYRTAKKGHRQRKTDALVKMKLYTLREEHHRCCGQKLQYLLQRDYGIRLGLSTIYRILRERYILRRGWKKNKKRGEVLKGDKPRVAVQVDTVVLGEIFAFTCIDTYTKESVVLIQDALTANKGKETMETLLHRWNSIEHLQRDGGPEFKAECERYLKEHVGTLRTARPYRKNEQAFIEKFNATLRKECVGHIQYKKQDLPEVQAMVDNWLIYYHTKRPHMSLGMLTPYEFVQQHSMSHLT